MPTRQFLKLAKQKKDKSITTTGLDFSIDPGDLKKYSNSIIQTVQHNIENAKLKLDEAEGDLKDRLRDYEQQMLVTADVNSLAVQENDMIAVYKRTNHWLSIINSSTMRIIFEIHKQKQLEVNKARAEQEKIKAEKEKIKAEKALIQKLAKEEQAEFAAKMAIYEANKKAS
ncbi:MAG: hypothetical protein L3J71_12030 [Victivallaceae bacterium]|nr:hypothetical protein [Victivallaceae bacterium]